MVTTKQGSVDPLRRQFVSLFASAMQRGVHPLQTRVFMAIFLVYPFTFLFVLALHTLGGFSQNYLLNFFLVEFGFSTILFLLFLYKDWEMTRFCTRRIFYHNPSWEKELRATAHSEWVKPDNKPVMEGSEAPLLRLVSKR